MHCLENRCFRNDCFDKKNEQLKAQEYKILLDFSVFKSEFNN